MSYVLIILKFILSSLCIYIYIYMHIYTFTLSFIHFYRLSCRFQYALLIYFYRFPNNGKIVQNFGFIYPLLIFVLYWYLWLLSFFLSYLLLSGITFFLPEELFRISFSTVWQVINSSNIFVWNHLYFILISERYFYWT